MTLEYTTAHLKTCKGCDNTLPRTSQFWWKHKITADGWKSKCKKCYGYSYTEILGDGNHRCSKCKKELPRTARYFNRNRTNASGFASACKVCKGSSEYGLPEENIANAIARQKAKAKNQGRDRLKILASNKIYGMRDRSLKHGVDFDYTLMDWELAKAHFNHSCAVCGQSQFPKTRDTVLSPDHWIPMSKGGDSTALNIIPLCHGIGGCNNSKRDYDPVEWLTGRYYERDVEIILARIEAYFDHVSDEQSNQRSA